MTNDQLRPELVYPEHVEGSKGDQLKVIDWVDNDHLQLKSTVPLLDIASSDAFLTSGNILV